jgi:long-chain acyl-CoA synthetase
MAPARLGAATVIGSFLDRAAQRATHPLWYHQVKGRWTPITWDMARTQVLSLAAGVASLGIAPGDRVGLVGANRPEWVIADYALQHIGAVVVPLYPTSPADQIAHILQRTGARVCLVDSDQLAGQLREAAVPGLGVVIGLHLGDVEHPQLIGRGSLVARGEAWLRENPTGLTERLRAVQPDTVATVIFTSGTDGDPKGAVLSHRNLTWAADAAARAVDVGAREIALSFLPLAHSFERVVTTVVPLVAATQRWTCWFVDDIAKLPAALRSVRPTIFIAVPLVWTRMQARILAETQAAGIAGRSFSRLMLAAGESAVRRRDDDRRVPPLTKVGATTARLLGRRIRRRIGLGRCWFAVSGAAPLQPETQRFFQALGLPLHQGWGLTETAALCAVQRPDDLEVGVVGAPIDGVEIRLGMDGEVLVRGPNVFIGYEAEAERTAAVFDRDGFFRTGDVGRLAADGRLAIVDRVKDVIITAGGRKVAPRAIEEKLRADPLIAGAIILGEGRSRLAALISIDGVEARRIVDLTGATDIWEHPKIRQRIDRTVTSVNRSLPEPEHVFRFAIVPFGFPDEALTPTHKVKRRVIEATFADMIEELYA